MRGNARNISSRGSQCSLRGLKSPGEGISGNRVAPSGHLKTAPHVLLNCSVLHPSHDTPPKGHQSRKAKSRIASGCAGAGHQRRIETAGNPVLRPWKTRAGSAPDTRQRHSFLIPFLDLTVSPPEITLLPPGGLGINGGADEHAGPGGRFAVPACALAYSTTRTSVALGPFCPCVVSNSTLSPSRRLLKDSP